VRQTTQEIDAHPCFFYYFISPVNPLRNLNKQSELRKDVEITLKQLEDEHSIKERAPQD
jgi:hypothetical protein